jgi:hypothetical protein
MSPFEHVAQALGVQQWHRIAKSAAEKWVEHGVPVGNFWGWLQYRKMLEDEHDFSIVKRKRGVV